MPLNSGLVAVMDKTVPIRELNTLKTNLEDLGLYDDVE